VVGGALFVTGFQECAWIACLVENGEAKVRRVADQARVLVNFGLLRSTIVTRLECAIQELCPRGTQWNVEEIVSRVVAG
jgi:hypothetical protein